MATYEHEKIDLDAGEDAPQIEKATQLVEADKSPALADPGATGRALAPTPSNHPAQVFNPLDANPKQLTANIQKRQENYATLREYLRNSLVESKDFGKIHVIKDCPDGKWKCQNPGHWSGWELFDPGADKILGVMGLGIKYDDVMADYRRASLRGMDIRDVIVGAKVVSDVEGTQVISEGTGACSLAEKGGSLNLAIKFAQKRARIDAVKRLPGVSALFDSDFFDTIPPKQRSSFKPSETAAQREQEQRPKATGKLLTTMPFGTQKGKKFTDLDNGMLEWIIKKLHDKPDIHYTAVTELERRKLQDTTVHTSKKPAPTVDDQNELSQAEIPKATTTPGADAYNQLVKQGFDDDSLPPLDAY